MVMDVEIKQVICKVLLKHQICKVSIPSLLSLSPLFFVRKHMPDREKLMPTCYTPSHGGERTLASAPSPPSLRVQGKKQRQKWLAEPNTVLPVCFTSISSPVKRQNTLKFCFPSCPTFGPRHTWVEKAFEHTALFHSQKIGFPFFPFLGEETVHCVQMRKPVNCNSGGHLFFLSLCSQPNCWEGMTLGV